jgi:hypothetical protein
MGKFYDFLAIDGQSERQIARWALFQGQTHLLGQPLRLLCAGAKLGLAKC